MSPTQDDVFTDVGNAIQSVIKMVPIARGFDNRVPSPPQDGYIILSELNNKRLSTNVETFNEDLPNGISQIDSSQSLQFAIQIDCYGPLAGDWSASLTNLFRSDYACAQMVNSQPLHADDPMQMPLVDGEQQYEKRWIVTLYVQYNPVLSTQMEFGDVVTPTIISTPADLTVNLS